MDDLEITRRCAKALGLKGICVKTASFVGDTEGVTFVPFCDILECTYDPLHDDTQAMALVKKFYLRIDRTRGIPEQWGVYSRRDFGDVTISDDLNRAICECVARTQEGK